MNPFHLIRHALMKPILRAVTLPVLALVVAAAPLLGQDDPLGTRGLGRPYLHVFLAYAVVLVLVGGWVITIARRLSRIERRLPDAD